ncbi:MAG: molecular chaperone DnaK, partial [Myxococcota bacterium]|nr:molecular chaperone DnaK [Myxococcota bacterium]
KGQRLSGQAEMMQMLAALEKLSATQKESVGAAFLKNPKKFGTWLPLGRLGSRSPFYGDDSTVVGPDVASQWVHTLLELDWKKSEGAAFAATLMARMTGDTNRDLELGLREQLAERLKEEKSAVSWREMVLRPTNLSEKDASKMLGEALPVGLRLD